MSIHCAWCGEPLTDEHVGAGRVCCRLRCGNRLETHVLAMARRLLAYRRGTSGISVTQSAKDNPLYIGPDASFADAERDIRDQYCRAVESPGDALNEYMRQHPGERESLELYLPPDRTFRLTDLPG